MACSVRLTAGATGDLRRKASAACLERSTWAWLTWWRAVSSVIALKATSGRCSMFRVTAEAFAQPSR